MKKIYILFFSLFVVSTLVSNTQVFAQNPTQFFQKRLLQDVRKEIKENKLKFCETYEDFEECKEDPPAGPDGPIDDGEGGGQEEPGPDDGGDGL